MLPEYRTGEGSHEMKEELEEPYTVEHDGYYCPHYQEIEREVDQILGLGFEVG